MKTMLEQPPHGTQVRWTDCPDRQSWANKAAEKIVELLDGSIASRGVASLVVAGGTTPQPIFNRLSQMHLDWPKVHVGLTDERWVKASHRDSNEYLVRHSLLRNQAKSAHFHPLYIDKPRPSAAIAEAERTISAMPRPFDVVLLGMGTDGHFASLFPGLPETKAGLDLHNPALCVAVDKQQNGYRAPVADDLGAAPCAADPGGDLRPTEAHGRAAGPGRRQRHADRNVTVPPQGRSGIPLDRVSTP